ncbi:hypothetical protein UFOVP274_10 [uncultured Caudovirales phage]|uniref:Uncharacterized protein n=1 Tax=uncultured Caudovirales phage TaxID=2100421 RepID=A0A6J5LMN5_9CAUD|nr:hypothetical protein UFOVP274_10 [uncultured Caudovirales phage]
MAYPTVSAPYGFKPVNLIGGQVFSGSTREYPIQYGYTVPLFYGDCVTLTAGFITQVGSSNYNNPGAKGTVGVFLGCSYTDPSTKQKRFSQYYPGTVNAGDIKAIVCDDPDTVFKCAATTANNATTIGSVSALVVGGSLAGTTTLTGSTATGDSSGGIVAGSASAGTTGIPFRVLALVPESQISTSCTYVSGGAAAATSVVVSGLTVGQVLPIGTDVYNLVSGQLQYTGATLSSASTVSTTGNTTLTVTSITTQVAGTVVLIQSPEALVKFNFGVHNYYAA